MALRSPTGEVVRDYYHYYCNWTMMIMKMLSEHFQEIYHYSESIIVFKTVNWSGTNILVFSIYTVLLQLGEGSEYLKRIANFRKRKRTLFGESCFLGSSSTLQKGFYLLKKIVPILCEHLLDATFIDDRALSISPILISTI